MIENKQSFIDGLAAQEQMGHSDVKTTFAIYTHLNAQHKEHDMGKMDAFLQSNATSNVHLA